MRPFPPLPTTASVLLLSLLAPGTRAASLSMNDLTHAEGTGGTTDFVFTVNLSAPETLPVSVDYATRDGTAAAGSDYIAAAGIATFPPGTTSRPVTVQVVGDADPEPSEYFLVDLADPVNASIDDGTGMGTITDDDALPVASINNVSRSEGDSGSSAFTFTVGLDIPAPATVTLDYATADGTAQAPGDYAAASGTVSFAAGESSRPIIVDVVGDTIFESDQTFQVHLSNPSGLTIGDGTGLGTIVDDEPPVEISIDDAVGSEGDASAAGMAFTVSLSGASEFGITVDYATADVETSAGIDYAAAAGTLVGPAGETTQDLVVTVHDDPDFEIDESFLILLSRPVNAVLVDGNGLGTIANDDVDCAPLPGHVTDLLLEPQSGGAELAFTWTDIPDADDYFLFEDEVPAGPCPVEAGFAASGAPGIVVPVPEESRYYPLAGHGYACGSGPRRLCAHDPGAVGVRLDSACEPCVAWICIAEPGCCATSWDANCVAMVPTVCGGPPSP